MEIFYTENWLFFNSKFFVRTKIFQRQKHVSITKILGAMLNSSHTHVIHAPWLRWAVCATLKYSMRNCESEIAHTADNRERNLKKQLQQLRLRQNILCFITYRYGICTLKTVVERVLCRKTKKTSLHAEVEEETLMQLLWRQTTYIGVFNFSAIFAKKNSSFRLHNQRPSSSAHCARELLSGSNGSASLVDCTRKKIFCLWGAGFF